MWRSLMFVPVLEERLLAKAADRGADALVLDLEASIADSRKNEAREALGSVVNTLSQKAEVTVRINPVWLDAVRDLEACVIDGVTAIHLARCEGPEEIIAVDKLIGELEAERGMTKGAISLVALLESAKAVINAPAIAQASTRLCGLTLGVEDYATEMGVAASDDVLQPAGYQVIQAARASNLNALVVPVSMSSFRDLDSLERGATRARALGSVGGYAIHPDQVPVLNRVFSPNSDEIAWANRVVAAADEAESAGTGVFTVDGAMIDLPLIKRARRIMARSDSSKA